jgi:hypothetical protein
MSTTGPARPVSAEEHCLVHHFIRAHGRRPTADELDELVRRAVVVPAPRRHAATAPSLAQSLRRELARLVGRL